MAKLIENDPLGEADSILSSEFYGSGKRLAKGTIKPKPSHYKIVCISLYLDDIERLEALVAEAKARGNTKANKSSVIRYALDALDISKMPKGY